MLEEEKATATIAPSSVLGLVKKLQLFNLFASIYLLHTYNYIYYALYLYLYS